MNLQIQQKGSAFLLAFEKQFKELFGNKQAYCLDDSSQNMLNPKYDGIFKKFNLIFLTQKGTQSTNGDVSGFPILLRLFANK